MGSGGLYLLAYITTHHYLCALDTTLGLLITWYKLHGMSSMTLLFSYLAPCQYTVVWCHDACSLVLGTIWEWHGRVVLASGDLGSISVISIKCCWKNKKIRQNSLTDGLEGCAFTLHPHLMLQIKKKYWRRQDSPTLKSPEKVFHFWHKWALHITSQRTHSKYPRLSPISNPLPMPDNCVHF